MGKKNNFITSIAMPLLNRLYRRRSTIHRKENRYASVHIKVIYDRLSPVIKQRRASAHKSTRTMYVCVCVFGVCVCMRIYFIFTIYLQKQERLTRRRNSDARHNAPSILAGNCGAMTALRFVCL